MAVPCPVPDRMWASDAMRPVILLAAWPAIASAEIPLTGAEFQAHVGQNTFSYLYSNAVRGVADYGPDRTLLWAFEGDACFRGQWFEDGSDICFAFEDGSLSACWAFYLDGNRLRGVATRLGSGNPPDIEIFEEAHTDQPLSCGGPDVGV
jgi:hypothetical protein